jgi:hypothetical protein
MAETLAAPLPAPTLKARAAAFNVGRAASAYLALAGLETGADDVPTLPRALAQHVA